MRALGFEVFWALDFCGGAGGGGESVGRWIWCALGLGNLLRVCAGRLKLYIGKMHL